MSPKKAAKKIANKEAAKKSAKKTAKHPGHELRRAYEHMRRLNILHSHLSAEALEEVETLSRAARGALAAGEHKSAADLLRAAEHLAFGSLASEEKDASISKDQKVAAREEYEHLADRAAAHWDEYDRKRARPLASIYKGMLKSAKAARKAKAFHRSLEFVRGADALAHVQPFELRVEADEKPPKHASE